MTVVLAREIVRSAERSPPPDSPVPVAILLVVDAFPARSETRLVTWLSAICIDVFEAAVRRPFASTVKEATCVAEP